MQQPLKSNVEERKEVPPPTATMLQPENPVEHSPITESAGELTRASTHPNKWRTRC